MDCGKTLALASVGTACSLISLSLLRWKISRFAQQQQQQQQLLQLQLRKEEARRSCCSESWRRSFKTSTTAVAAAAFASCDVRVSKSCAKTRRVTTAIDEGASCRRTRQPASTESRFGSACTTHTKTTTDVSRFAAGENLATTLSIQCDLLAFQQANCRGISGRHRRHLSAKRRTALQRI